MLSIDGITKSFGGVRALSDATLEVGRGEIVGLIGPNGSGKSTLVDVLTGFVRPDSGTIRLGGRRLTGMPEWKISRAGVRRTFQLPQLPREMTTIETLLCGDHRLTRGRWLDALRPRAVAAADSEAIGRAEALLELTGLTKARDQAPAELSGGQQKLLGIALALMAEPVELLVLDEPVAGVAPPLRDQLVEMIRAQRARGITVLLIEHDMAFVGRTCDYVHVLDEGTVVARCRPSELADHPRVVEAYLGNSGHRELAGLGSGA